jgi:hypothetical protein
MISVARLETPMNIDDLISAVEQIIRRGKEFAHEDTVVLHRCAQVCRIKPSLDMIPEMAVLAEAEKAIAEADRALSDASALLSKVWSAGDCGVRS